MRHRMPQRHPRRARSRVLAGVAALLAVIAIIAVVAGCSSDAAPAPTPPVAAPGSIADPRTLRSRWRGPRRSACTSRPSASTLR